LGKNISSLLIILLILISCRNSGTKLFREYLNRNIKNKIRVSKNIDKDYLLNIRASLSKPSRFVMLDNKYIFTDFIRNEKNNIKSVGLFHLTKNFDIKLIKKLKMGKGPNEVFFINSIFKINDRFYFFDRELYRFLVYDKNFNYIDILNYNCNVFISNYFKVKNELWGYISTNKKIIFYKIILKKYDIKLKKQQEINFNRSKFKTEVEEKSVRYSRFLKKSDNIFLYLISNNLIYIKKENNRFSLVNEVYLGKSKKGEIGYNIPNIKNVDNNLNVLFYLDGYKIYNYKKDKIINVNKPYWDLVIEFDDRTYFYKRDKGFYYSKKK